MDAMDLSTWIETAKLEFEYQLEHIEGPEPDVGIEGPVFSAELIEVSINGLRLTRPQFVQMLGQRGEWLTGQLEQERAIHAAMECAGCRRRVAA